MSSSQRFAQWLASSIGTTLQQDYRAYEGGWWLFTLGRPSRALQVDEIAWHVARNHAPFVEGGVLQGTPHWWDDPV